MYMLDNKTKELPQCKFCKSRLNSVFNKVKNNELEQFDLNKSFTIYKKGQIIFNEGNHANGLYCIHQGKIKVYKLGSEGKEQIVRLAKNGEVLGYRALISNELYSATAEVLEPSMVCFIPKSAIFSVLDNDHELSLRMMKMLCRDLKNAEERLTNIAQKPVRERVAEVLLLLLQTFGIKDDKTINVSLTREDLASIVGTATESVIRLLSEFKKNKLIDLQGKKIKILDQMGLVRLGHYYD